MTALGAALLAALVSSCAGRRVAETPARPGAVTVKVVWPGASAADVASMVAKPLEPELAAIVGVSRIITRCEEGNCTISLQYSPGGPGDAIAYEAANAVKRLEKALPSDAMAAVSSHDLYRGPDLVIALILSADKPGFAQHEAALDFAANIMQLPAVVQYEVPGAPTREIAIEVDRARASAFGIEPAEVADAIRKYRIPLDRFTVAAVRSKQNTEEIGEIIVKTVGNADIRLKDVARVSTVVTQGLLYRVDGEPAIIINVFLRSDVGRAEADTCLKRILALPVAAPFKRLVQLPAHSGRW